MGVAKGRTSGKKVSDFVTERTNPCDQKWPLVRRKISVVNLFQRVCWRVAKRVQRTTKIGRNAMIEKELDTV